jgi:hypothetical protein
VLIEGIDSHARDAERDVARDPEEEPELHPLDGAHLHRVQDAGEGERQEDDEGEHEDGLEDGPEGDRVDERLDGDRHREGQEAGAARVDEHHPEIRALQPEQTPQPPLRRDRAMAGERGSGRHRHTAASDARGRFTPSCGVRIPRIEGCTADHVASRTWTSSLCVESCPRRPEGRARRCRRCRYHGRRRPTSPFHRAPGAGSRPALSAIPQSRRILSPRPRGDTAPRERGQAREILGCRVHLR